MTCRGKIKEGVVVLENGVPWPEGTEVVVTLAEPVEESAATPPRSTIGDRMVALARWAETQPCDLPEDLAKNHDHYLHSLPKRP